MYMYPLSKFISIEVAILELGGGGGFTQPPPPDLGQGVGQKRLGRARVKNTKGTLLQICSRALVFFYVMDTPCRA